MGKQQSSSTKPQRGHRWIGARTERYYAKATRRWCERYIDICSCGAEFDQRWDRVEAQKHMQYPRVKSNAGANALTGML